MDSYSFLNDDWKSDDRKESAIFDFFQYWIHIISCFSYSYLYTQYPSNPAVRTNIRAMLSHTISPVRNLIKSIQKKLSTVAPSSAKPIIHHVS